MPTDEAILYTDLFVSGEGGYHTYRIPALLATASGTLLAFCEGRRDDIWDAGQIDLLLRRSEDGGRSWGPVQCVVTMPEMTCGNPCPVQDARTGTILLPFCTNPADGDAGKINSGQATRNVWMTRSDDDGLHWETPWEITADVKLPHWRWYATGPGHAIQLASGRLLVPCNHNLREAGKERNTTYAHVIFSDDGGAHWQLGGVNPGGGNESCALQLADGSVYLNSRRNKLAGCRLYGISHDEGLTFTEWGDHAELVEPKMFSGGCQGSLLMLPGELTGGARVTLFCNPATAGEDRRNFAIRRSHDECRSWSQPRTVFAGHSGYSDLAGLPAGTLCAFFECGETHYFERLRLTRFSYEWLIASEDNE